MQTIELEAQRLRSLRAMASGALRLKWLAAATRFEIAAHRHGLALKYGFNPAQPRVPRGNPDGGEWTDAGGGGFGSLTGGRGGSRGDSRESETRDSRATGRIRLAGEIPTGDSPEVPEKPEVPRRSRRRRKSGPRSRKLSLGGWIVSGAPWKRSWWWRNSVLGCGTTPRKLNLIVTRLNR